MGQRTGGSEPRFRVSERTVAVVLPTTPPVLRDVQPQAVGSPPVGAGSGARAALGARPGLAVRPGKSRTEARSPWHACTRPRAPGLGRASSLCTGPHWRLSAQSFTSRLMAAPRDAASSRSATRYPTRGRQACPPSVVNCGAGSVAWAAFWAYRQPPVIVAGYGRGSDRSTARTLALWAPGPPDVRSQRSGR